MSVKNFVNYFVEESLRKMSLADIYDSDINKTCHEINSEPVDITPKAFLNNKIPFQYKNPKIINAYPSKSDSEKYLEKAEQLVEALHCINRQAVFEIKGNKKNITCSFYAEQDDIEAISSSIVNFYPKTITDNNLIENITENLFVYDFLPNAPFFKPLTTYHDFIISPLNMVPNLLLNLDENSIGVYQVIFKPLPGIVHKMVDEAIDCEWKATKGADNTTPSIESSAVNKKIEYKSPDFRSYFSVCVRIILPTDQLKNQVKAFISNYTYGSKAFKIIENESYGKEQILNMLNKRVSYHSGFLLNAHELTSLMHIPFQILKNKEFDDIFTSAPVGDKPLITPEYTDIVIGEWSCGAYVKEIHIPIQRDIPNIHVIGLPRSGKSTLLNHIAIEKFKKGEAVFVLDHHGDLIETIKKNIPKELIGKVIVIDFGLKDLTPQITIRGNVDITNPSRVSDDLSYSMKDVSTSRDKSWFGPRMAYSFSCLFFLYSILPDLNLTDIRLLVSPSKKGKNLRTKIKNRVKHPIVNDFLEEIDSTPFESLLPVVTRLSQLLLDEKSLRLFTIDTNKIAISDILENRKLCLINLACGIIGKQRSSILSGLMDSLITNNAFARASVPYEKRTPCLIIKDEFHLGPMDLDNQFTGIPKYNFSIVVAHQYVTQVEQRDIDVLATAGTKIIFKLGQKDAEFFARNLNDISPYEITSLKPFEAIVKIEDEVVKINTPKPIQREEDFSEEIMRYCITNYYIRHSEDKVENKKELLIDEI
ncbi:MAG: hypothetical protein C4541_04875 [Candidatus Auribacter fodinae]|jgi:GTPase SAR1 family protein|uniref:Uncharacterized protein n=1 Tax=Candidatus Auribacter fodinae TaxID=2093366 RepID=A0A3A4R627_9BACT|nr:MAG: hypothetical protein C4541_04875 [Candidatus Auribacter fodinae]